MAKSKVGIFLIVTFFSIFLIGFLFGYFLQGSTLIKAENEVEKVRKDIDNLQLEQLLLIQTPEKGCPAISISLEESSSRLYNIVNDLRNTNPTSEKYYRIKTDADVLSVRTWLLSTAIEDRCNRNVTSILEVYSSNCETCLKQAETLQSIKERSNGTVLVYSIDIDTNEKTVNVIKSSYNITSAPSIIIKGAKYGLLTQEEILAKI